MAKAYSPPKKKTPKKKTTKKRATKKASQKVAGLGSKLKPFGRALGRAAGPAFIPLEVMALIEMAGGRPLAEKDQIASVLSMLMGPDPQQMEHEALQGQLKSQRLMEEALSGAAAGRRIASAVPEELRFLMNSTDEGTLRTAAVPAGRPSIVEVAAKSGLI